MDSRKEKQQSPERCPKCEPAATAAATEDLTDEEYSELEKKAAAMYGVDIEAERRLMQREPTEMRRLRLWRARCRISFEMTENKKQLRNRYHGALLGLAAGDALGTTLEFKSPGTFIAALWAFYRSDTFKKGALLAANLGDDADTTAAVFGQLGGAFYGVDAIPAKWLAKLAMRELIEQMADDLLGRSLRIKF